MRPVTSIPGCKRLRRVLPGLLLVAALAAGYEIVWDAVTNRVPALGRDVARIIAEEFRGAEL